MLELDFIKNYLKITDTQDDELILTLRDGVKIFSQQFTKIKTDEQAPKDLENAILEHIAFLYENKGKSGLDIPSRIIYIYKKYKYFRI